MSHLDARRSLALAVSIGLALVAAPALGADLYVDLDLSGDCAGSYDVANRSCGGGTDTAYATLAAAAAAAQAGDSVLLREGTYGERLIPQSSGSAGQPITFAAHAGETATFSGISDPAIFVQGQSYIVIEGLHADDVLGWGRLEDASHIVVRDNVFTQATAGGTTGGFKLVRSNYNVLQGNRFEDGNDNVVVQESDHNLIEDNEFLRGGHSLLSLRCGDFNVIRANRFDNPDQKSAEIYDCEGVSDAPFELDATKHNLFDRNLFVFTLGSDMPHRYNGIQYAGQQGIVRRNLFYDNEGGGLGIQVYSDEALHNYGHRIYNNTFVDNRCFGLFASDDDAPNRYYDVQIENGLFFGNVDCSGAGEQTAIGNTTAVSFVGNELADSDPGFEDVAARDLRLTEQSPMVDAASFVTQAIGSGPGTELGVVDAGYFYDGYGIEGEQGDLIQIEGQTATARVVAIDYGSNVLSLDQSLEWADGDGVHLAYAGAAPDMGAIEFGDDIHTGGSGGTGTGGSGAAGGAGGTGTGGSGAGGTVMPGGEPVEDDGCGCRIAGSAPAGRSWLFWALAAAATLRSAGSRRRRSLAGRQRV